jgi:hypothetical protein
MIENSLSISNYLFGLKAMPVRTEREDIRSMANGRAFHRVIHVPIGARTDRQGQSRLFSPGTKSWGEVSDWITGSKTGNAKKLQLGF